MLSLEDLRVRNLVLLEAVSGSRAYGLATEESDTDIKGVFFLPRDLFYGLGYVAQVNDEGNNTVFYELGRFVELLLASNPNTLELLATPEDCLLFRHPLMASLRCEWFVSRACRQSFAGYAYGQIRKARGLNKKIVNPVAPEKKSVLDFCRVIEGMGSVAVDKWLSARQMRQENVGLAAVAHTRNVYALFYDAEGSKHYRGIVQKAHANGVCTSRIVEGDVPLAGLYFNQDGYSCYCREYGAYQQWLAERNEARYAATLRHAQGYDAKNMMHTFRLLEMAHDVACFGEVRVRRDNREELLVIKRGEFAYEDLLMRAEALMQRVDSAFAESSLPEDVHREAALAALVAMREVLYASAL